MSYSVILGSYGIFLQLSCVSIAGAYILQKPGCYDYNTLLTKEWFPWLAHSAQGKCLLGIGYTASGNILKEPTKAIWRDYTVSRHGVLKRFLVLYWIFTFSEDTKIFSQLNPMQINNPVICPIYLHLLSGDTMTMKNMTVKSNGYIDKESRKVYRFPARQYKPTDLTSIEKLLHIPCAFTNSGMIELEVSFYHASGEFEMHDFGMIYYSKSKSAVQPVNNTRVAVADFVEQLAIPQETREFTVEVLEGHQIWLQAIYLNLTMSAEEILYERDCNTSSNKLLIFFEAEGTNNCTADECLHTCISRSRFNMVKTTLVTETNIARIMMYCNQLAGEECALISYKTYNPDEDIGSCPHWAEIIQTHAEIEDQHELSYTFDPDPDSVDTQIWHLENTNSSITQISVLENTMDWSADCSSERVEIYNGKCARPGNLVTYFCDRLKEVYTLTASPYITIRAMGKRQSSFKLLFKVQARPAPPIPEIITTTPANEQVVAIGCSGVSNKTLYIVGPVVFFLILVIGPSIWRLARMKKRRPKANLPQLPMDITPLPDVVETPAIKPFQDEEFGKSFGSAPIPFASTTPSFQDQSESPPSAGEHTSGPHEPSTESLIKKPSSMASESPYHSPKGSDIAVPEKEHSVPSITEKKSLPSATEMTTQGEPLLARETSGLISEEKPLELASGEELLTTTEELTAHVSEEELHAPVPVEEISAPAPEEKISSPAPEEEILSPAPEEIPSTPDAVPIELPPTTVSGETIPAPAKSTEELPGPASEQEPLTPAPVEESPTPAPLEESLAPVSDEETLAPVPMEEPPASIPLEDLSTQEPIEEIPAPVPVEELPTPASLEAPPTPVQEEETPALATIEEPPTLVPIEEPSPQTPTDEMSVLEPVSITESAVPEPSAVSIVKPSEEHLEELTGISSQEEMPAGATASKTERLDTEDKSKRRKSSIKGKDIAQRRKSSIKGKDTAQAGKDKKGKKKKK